MTDFPVWDDYYIRSAIDGLKRTKAGEAYDLYMKELEQEVVNINAVVDGHGGYEYGYCRTCEKWCDCIKDKK